MQGFSFSEHRLDVWLLVYFPASLAEHVKIFQGMDIMNDVFVSESMGFSLTWYLWALSHENSMTDFYLCYYLCFWPRIVEFPKQKWLFIYIFYVTDEVRGFCQSCCCSTKCTRIFQIILFINFWGSDKNWNGIDLSPPDIIALQWDNFILIGDFVSAQF